jgi:hypothetical protein
VFDVHERRLKRYNQQRFFLEDHVLLDLPKEESMGFILTFYQGHHSSYRKAYELV